MKSLLLGLLPLALALAPALTGQNLLTNGDFEGGTLNGWTQIGFGTAINPTVQSFDVTGLGATQAFGVGVGMPPAGLGQQVPLATGVAYLLRADFAGEHPFSHTNADGGNYEVFVGGTSIARGSLGTITGFETLRQHVCIAFAVPATGPTNVELRIFRGFNASGVRNYLDNVELIPTTLPVVCIHEARRIGTTVNVDVTGTPNTPFAVLLSSGRLPAPGLVIPGIRGSLLLSPVLIVQLTSGVLDASGAASSPLPLPNNPWMVGMPLWFQGFEGGAAPSLGSLHAYPLIP